MSATLPPQATEPTGDAQRRAREGAFYVALAIGVVALTCALWTIHPVLGLAMTFLAKHLLVAIIAAALRIPVRSPFREP